jgi:hypothetical protein
VKPTARYSVTGISIFCLVVVTTASLGAFGLYGFFKERHEGWNRLSATLSVSYDQLAAGLVNDTWDVDYAQVKIIMASVLLNPEIQSTCS